MPSSIRVTRGKEFTTSGTLGMQVNVFGLTKLQAGINGEAIAPILVDALQPALETAKGTWPILTGASIESMRVDVIEVNAKSARAVLQIGGEQLIGDPRNISRKDYAPFIEYNGSPSGRGQGSMVNAFYGNEAEMRRIIHDGVALLIAELLA